MDEYKVVEEKVIKREHMCRECGGETDIYGDTLYEGCYYCPETCEACGRGFCDGSC